MNDRFQNPNAPTPLYPEWHEQPHSARLVQRQEGVHLRDERLYNWVGGMVLVMLGMIFLIQEMDTFFLPNWWAVLILIPASVAFVAAWGCYRQKGLPVLSGVASLTVGILLTFLALILLLLMDAVVFWPALLIAGGSVLFATAWLPE